MGTLIRRLFKTNERKTDKGKSIRWS